MMRFDTKPYFKQTIKFTDHTAHEVLKTKAGQSNHLHCPALHVVIDIDIGLGSTDMSVSSQAHEHSYPHTLAGEVGDKCSAPRMTAGTFYPCTAIDVVKVLG